MGMLCVEMCEVLKSACPKRLLFEEYSVTKSGVEIIYWSKAFTGQPKAISKKS
jgi:hypothetical protein